MWRKETTPGKELAKEFDHSKTTFVQLCCATFTSELKNCTGLVLRYYKLSERTFQALGPPGSHSDNALTSDSFIKKRRQKKKRHHKRNKLPNDKRQATKRIEKHTQRSHDLHKQKNVLRSKSRTCTSSLNERQGVKSTNWKDSRTSLVLNRQASSPEQWRLSSRC